MTSIDEKVANYRNGLIRGANPPEKAVLDRMVVGYRNSLVRDAIERRTPPPETGTPILDAEDPGTVRRSARLNRIAAQLAAVQARIASSDLTRMRRLLALQRLHLDAGNLQAVHGAALELAHMTRVATLGLESEHPMSVAPPPRLSSLPPPSYIDEAGNEVEP